MSKPHKPSGRRPDFCSRGAPPPDVLRGLDALVTSCFAKRRKTIAAPQVAPGRSLTEFAEDGHRGRLSARPDEFIAAAMASRPDSKDPFVAAASAALLRGDFVEGLTPVEAARATHIASVALGWRAAPCHVVTPSTEMAKTWAEGARKLCAGAGLTLTAIDAGATPAERQKAYTADIVAVASRTLMADWARDQFSLGALMHPQRRSVAQLGRIGRARAANTVTRGLGSVLILDTEQSLFIDAVAPVRLTKAIDNQLLIDHCHGGIEFARTLERGVHFTCKDGAPIDWTSAGERAMQESGVHPDFVANAVRALYLLERGRDYQLDGDQLTLIDRSTEEKLEGRSFRQGLQQTVELLEGLKPSPLHESVVQLSVPGFYRQPTHLAGCGLDLGEYAAELRCFYHKRLSSVRPSRRAPSIALLADRGALGDEILHRASSAADKPAIVAPTKSDAESIRKGLRGECVVTCSSEDQPPDEGKSILYTKVPSTRAARSRLATTGRVQFLASLDDPMLRDTIPTLCKFAARITRRHGTLAPVLARALIGRAWRKRAKLARRQRAKTYRSETWGQSILAR